MGKIQRQGGQTLIGGLNRVYHCNHYNAHLQMMVMMSKGVPGADPDRLLVDAAAPLIVLLRKQGYSEQELLTEFSFCGYGKLKQLDAETWQTPSSHYGQSTYSHGKPEKSCFFNAGYIQGLNGRFTEETDCQTTGAVADVYKQGAVQALDDYLIYPAAFSEVPERFAFDDCQDFQIGVDEAAIISAVQKLPLYGKFGAQDDGLIHAFGVVLTNHFADYYNRISYETFFAMQQAGIPEDEVSELFIQSGHICAFNTFGGIMSSLEWYAAIAPMCENREDWLHGMLAVINSLGWGIYRLERLSVEKELVVRIYNSYEGVGYRRMYPQAEGSNKNLSFLAMGAMLGLVHLLWKVDIRERPTLDHDFYVNQFNNPENSYRVEQTHAIATGDPYDRVIVYR